MWLTKNEKKVLKLLVDDARLSDTFIANELNITSQAIGRIRRKLEEEIIKKYTLELDLSKLDLDLLIVGKVSIATEEPSIIKEAEKKLKEIKQNIGIFKLIRGDNEYIFLSLYKDMNDLNNLINNERKTQKIAPLIKINEMYQIPLSNILKYSHTSVYQEYIDRLGIKKNNLFLSKKPCII